MSRLLVSLGSLPLLGFKLGNGTFRLGRDTGCDIVLSLPDVADEHVELSRRDGEAWVRALSEENITVNGRSGRRFRLQTGDVASLGGYRIRWVDGDDEADENDGRDPTRRLRPVRRARKRTLGAILVVEGPDHGRSASLDVPLLIVGRSPDSDLRLTDDSVSWHHLAVELDDGQARLRDLGSSNGTFLGSRRIESVQAEPGERVRIGETLLELQPPPSPGEREEQETGLAELVGSSPAMLEVYRQIRAHAESSLPVLVLGEAGTGKELAARALHALSPRASEPFVPIHCAAIPRDTIESELFGPSDGVFERGQRGTIFLDEISELPSELQSRLLLALEGAAASEAPHSFRLVAASNRDLCARVQAGSFRDDLYYRLAGLQIRMPPLRERLTDLPVLVERFLQTVEEENVGETGGTRFAADALAALARHPWSGNVRELKTVVLQCVTRRPGAVVDASLVEAALTELPDSRRARPQSLKQVELEAIRNALQDCRGSRRAAARRLGISESTLYVKIKEYGLQRVGLDRPSD